jgi:hypothetical protein
MIQGARMHDYFFFRTQNASNRRITPRRCHYFLREQNTTLRAARPQSRTNGTIHGVFEAEAHERAIISEPRASCLFCSLPFSILNKTHCRQTYVVCGPSH